MHSFSACRIACDDWQAGLLTSQRCVEEPIFPVIWLKAAVTTGREVPFGKKSGCDLA